MSKVVSQTIGGNVTDQQYKALANYFDPQIGDSEEHRRGYHAMLSNEFLLKDWEVLSEKIANSNETFDQVVRSIINKDSCTSCRAFLLYLISELIPEVFSLYLLRLVKIYAATNFLGSNFLVCLGEQDSFHKSPLWTGKKYGAKLAGLIKTVIKSYWEDYDDIPRGMCGRSSIVMKYAGKTSQLNNRGPLTESRKFISNFNRLKELIIDVVKSNDSIKVLKNKHGADIATMIKLFEDFNPTKLQNLLEDQLEHMIQDNKPIVSIHEAFYAVFGIQNDIDESRRVAGSNLKKEYDKLVETKIKEQMVRRKKSNMNLLRQRKKSFSLVYLNQNRIKLVNIDIAFSTIPLFDEWAEFFLACGDQIRKHRPLIELLNYIAKRRADTKFLSVKDIDKEDISNFLDNGISSQRTSKWAIGSFRNMITYLIDREAMANLPFMGQLPKAPMYDVSIGISVKVPDENNRQPLPDGVFDQIMLYIDELEPTYKNAFILSAAGGLRPNECEGITADSLAQDGSTKVLEVWQFKVQASHMIKGKKPIRRIKLYDERAINAFREQVIVSEEAREISGVESIFVKKIAKGNAYGIVDSAQMRNAVNRLIMRHNICDVLSEKPWHYTPYQLRVSLVVEMIESGANDMQLKAFFGWLAKETMDNAYYMAKKLKIMEMNTAFFKKEFSINLSQKVIDRYSEEELQEIVAMFYATSRKMMYGRCMRHPSQGICGKLHEASACAPCHNLKVAPNYRKQWEEIYTNQYIQLKRLRHYYEQRNHQPEQFEKYEFYITQSGVLDAYFSVLFNIDK